MTDKDPVCCRVALGNFRRKEGTTRRCKWHTVVCGCGKIGEHLSLDLDLFRPRLLDEVHPLGCLFHVCGKGNRRPESLAECICDLLLNLGCDIGDVDIPAGVDKALRERHSNETRPYNQCCTHASTLRREKSYELAK